MTAARILLVDDTPTVLFANAALLQREGYAVKSASSGREALKMLRQDPTAYDLIISDLRMPEMDGTTLLERVRSFEQLKMLPFLMLTRSDDEQDVLDALNAGASDFVRKSCPLPELFARVRNLVRMKHLQDWLKRSSETDPLTGLSNRRHGVKSIQQELARVRRYGRPLSVALLDIDHFKRINDQHGHQRGDEVLVYVSTALREVSRDSDALIRWGGEEFLFVFPETSAVDAARVVERLRVHLASAPHGQGDDAVTVTLSGGVAQFEEGDTLDSLVDRADRGLYRAKETGRNRLLRWEGDHLVPVEADAA